VTTVNASRTNAAALPTSARIKALRIETRSSATPAAKPKSKTGSVSKKTVIPRSVPLPVRSNTKSGNARNAM